MSACKCWVAETTIRQMDIYVLWGIANLAFLAWAATSPRSLLPYALITSSYALQFFSWPVATTVLLGRLLVMSGHSWVWALFVYGRVTDRWWPLIMLKWSLTIAIFLALPLSQHAMNQGQ